MIDEFLGVLPKPLDDATIDAAWEHPTLSWSLLNESPVPMALLGSDGRFLRINVALGDLLQFEEAELTESFLCELALPHESMAEPNSLLELANGRQSLLQSECRFCRKDGTVAATRLSLSRGADPLGRRRLLAVFEDLSGREELERQLRQSQKTESLGRLAGGIIHDFSNMLAVIVGYSQLLLDGPPLDDDQRRRIEIVLSAGKQAESFTRQLLEFSRRQGMSPQPVDLNELMEGTVPWLRCLVGEDIDLSLSLDPGLNTVRADPAQLEQVLLNLVVNAREAMPQGGQIRIETHSGAMAPQPSMDQGAERLHGYVALSVSDTGVGMDAPTREKIFEPFFTTKAEGSGLGLATVASIVQENAGKIVVQSEPGRGSVFTLLLPPAGQTTPGETPRYGENSLAGTETILLVEDERMVRNYVRDVLELHGYTVLTAAGSAEALSVSQAHDGPIHLLVTDVVMPAMSGRELSERIGLLRPETRVLFMSGYTDDAVVRHGVLTAETAFLQKPFLPEVLAHKVRELLGDD